ncbi:hypothetical protein [Bradyrhizobium sp. SRS-191]|uniref:hypothetical protein n=1 Tax=Bradyrhizobium sp. SRS-191 TaxID=2962606 RepID=UPI00211EE07C|nr:hypothetical protein [Bradyrhizobium sp. SRS-191]
MRAVMAGGALLMILPLGGCATSNTPAPEASGSFQNTYNYLPVNDVPHDDQRPVLSVEQQEKLRKELMSVRDRQLPAAVKGTPAKPSGSNPAPK